MVGLHGPTLGEGWWSESIYRYLYGSEVVGSY